jgi:predicted alpha/beta superfamily hydrolase
MSFSFFNLSEVSAGGVGLAEAPQLVRHEAFTSQFLDQKRDLIVYLPPEYYAEANADRRYPVMYLHDGQNLFDPETAYIPGQDWKVNETADRLVAEGAIEPMIIVGIYNTGKQRINEYTPTKDKKLGGGHAVAYGRMLVEELKPFVDGEYRTMSDPSRTGLGGSSLGGLVTLYLGILYPHVFGRLAVLSPSVWWNNKVILDYVAEAVPKPRLKIWLDIGTKEDPRAVQNAEMLRDVLVKKGWQLGVDLQFTEAEGAEHNETAWAMRVEPMLRFLFPAL